MKTLFSLATIFVLSCSLPDNKSKEHKADPIDTISPAPAFKNDTISFHKLHKLFTIGDFDGDGTRDTIYQHNFSHLTKMEIDSAADPCKNDWSTVVKWFTYQQADVYLSFNKANKDSLHLGTAQGLYCLLNIGDLNKDGKDEIAIVIDHCDFSNLNSCKIYSICTGKWQQLRQFGINESAFDFTAKQPPVFNYINGYLQKQKSKWMYKDNDKKDSEIMQPLEVNSCN